MKINKTVGRKKKVARQEKPNEVEISLMGEDELQDINTNFLDSVICIFGESGAGKSTLCSQIPGAYFIQCDPKRTNLRIRQTLIPNKTIKQLKKERPSVTPWEMVVKVIQLCCEDDSVKVVVIDNFGLLYEHCLRHKCFKLMIDDPQEKNDYGQTWRDIENEFVSVLNEVVYKNKGMVVIAHDQTREVSLADGTTVDRIEPAVQKGALKWIKACTDYCFYLCRRAEGRTMIIRESPELDVFLKCCTDDSEPHFYQGDRPLRRIPMGNNAKTAWGNINQAYANSLPAPEQKKIKKK